MGELRIKLKMWLKRLRMKLLIDYKVPPGACLTDCISRTGRDLGVVSGRAGELQQGIRSRYSGMSKMITKKQSISKLDFYYRNM
jgi:hypothetical protein